MQPALIEAQVEPPRRDDRFRSLFRLQAPPDQATCLYAYCLNADLLKRDPDIPNEEQNMKAVYGAIFPLGAFPSREKAEQRAKEIIQATGYSGISVCDYARPGILRLDPDPATTVVVSPDGQGQLLQQLQESNYQRERRKFEDDLRQQQERVRELQASYDPATPEHFRVNCALAMQHLSEMGRLEQQMRDLRESYERRLHAVRTHYQQHPEHEADWLAFLKEKRYPRADEPYFSALLEDYREFRDKITR